jgi:PAS domain S-box-containing protein
VTLKGLVPIIVSSLVWIGCLMIWALEIPIVDNLFVVILSGGLLALIIWTYWQSQRSFRKREQNLRWETERRIQQMVSMNEELSRELQHSRLLEETREMQARAFDAFLQGVILTDPTQPNNPIVYVNDGFVRLSGYCKQEVLGRSIDYLFHAEGNSSQWEKIEQAIQSRKPLHIEFLSHRKDNSPLWTTISVAPVYESGRLVNLAFVLTDISELKRYELQARQTSKMEAIGHLAGGIAHDFNNLLLIINGSCELISIENDNLPATVTERIEEIHQAGQRAAELTQQLLAFSRKAVLQPKIIQLNSLIEKLKKTLLRLIGEDIILMSNLATDLKKVFVDPTQMEQLIINMAVNARDAMQTGGTIRIETRNFRNTGEENSGLGELPVGDYVLLSITDTGHGMSPEILARIFEPFFTTKGIGKGTGLGLAMAYGVVKSFGGHIAVESQEGRGSTFRVYLPVATGQTSRPSSAADIRPHGNETILLVEDEPSVRKVAAKALQSHGYVVLSANDGIDALLILKNHRGPIDLLLTDVVMPGMSGRELREEIDLIRPIANVIYMSSYTDDEVVRHGITEAECDFIHKPFTIPELLKKVRQVLDREKKAHPVGLVTNPIS